MIRALIELLLVCLMIWLAIAGVILLWRIVVG
jgi:hypothetical protein